MKQNRICTHEVFYVIDECNLLSRILYTEMRSVLQTESMLVV